MRKGERVVKSRPSWRRTSQVKKLRIVMTVIAVILFGSIAAGGVMVWIQLHPPQAAGPMGSLTPLDKLPEKAGSELPVYENSFNLVIASQESPMPDGWEPQLTEFQGASLDARMLPALQQMLAQAQDSGFELSFTGTYVSPEEQETLYRAKVDELIKSGYTRVKAEDSAQSLVERGGRSECQTGMTLRFDTSDSKVLQWLTENSVDYGFVQRYPKNKTSYTGKEYDQELFRYVGTENARNMRSLVMCLEEYAGYVAQQG